MGRYKDYREPKRRGYDDDYVPQDRVAERRPGNPRPSALQASEPVEAIVKWFNAEKGFGFVAVVGGSEAFMHIRQLEAAGHSSVPEGARVKVRIGQGQKGPEVTEVIEVDTSVVQVAGTTARRAASRSVAQRQPGVGATEQSIGHLTPCSLHPRARETDQVGQRGQSQCCGEPGVVEPDPLARQRPVDVDAAVDRLHPASE